MKRSTLVVGMVLSAMLGGGSVFDSSVFGQSTTLLFDEFNPQTPPAAPQFDEIIGIKSFEFVNTSGAQVGYTFVAGTTSTGSDNSVITVARYQHYPESANPPVIFRHYPVNSDRQIRRARAMDAFRNFNGFFRMIVAAEIPGLEGQKDILTIGFNFDLNLLDPLDPPWTRIYSHFGASEDPLMNDDVPIAVSAIDGAVVVVGNSEDPNTGTDIVMLGYSPLDGSDVMPVRRYITSGEDTAADVVVVLNGPLAQRYAVVTGTTPTPGAPTLTSMVTIAVPVAQTVSPPPPLAVLNTIAGRTIVAAAMDINFDGSNYDVAIGGTTSLPVLDGSADYFASVRRLIVDEAPPHYPTGLPLRWERRIESSEGDDILNDIAIASTVIEDASEAWVWVTGKSLESSSGNDCFRTYQLQNLGLALGTTWWESRWNSQFGGADEGLRLDPVLSVNAPGLRLYATGRTKNTAGNWDVATLKFDSTIFGGNKPPYWTDPDPVLAIPIYTGSGGGDDVPSGLDGQVIGTTNGRYFLVGGRTFFTANGIDWLFLGYRDNQP